ncbi:MAG: hypothetical protein M1814_005593 [Vezdaea aestivalis]|nr:MAG: hypothetical protein M1814_005593 [Vezdaea aestivalis]
MAAVHQQQEGIDQVGPHLDYATAARIKMDRYSSITSRLEAFGRRRGARSSENSAGSVNSFDGVAGDFDFSTAQSIGKFFQGDRRRPKKVATQLFERDAAPAGAGLKRRATDPKPSSESVELQIRQSQRLPAENIHRRTASDESGLKPPTIPVKSPARMALLSTLETTGTALSPKSLSAKSSRKSGDLAEAAAKDMSTVQERRSSNNRSTDSNQSTRSAEQPNKEQGFVTTAVLQKAETLVEDSFEATKDLASSTISQLSSAADAMFKGAGDIIHNLQEPPPDDSYTNYIVTSADPKSPVRPQHHNLLQPYAEPYLSEFLAPPVLTETSPINVPSDFGRIKRESEESLLSKSSEEPSNVTLAEELTKSSPDEAQQIEDIVQLSDKFIAELPTPDFSRETATRFLATVPVAHRGTQTLFAPEEVFTPAPVLEDPKEQLAPTRSTDESRNVHNRLDLVDSKPCGQKTASQGARDEAVNNWLPLLPEKHTPADTTLSAAPGVHHPPEVTPPNFRLLAEPFISHAILDKKQSLGSQRKSKELESSNLQYPDPSMTSNAAALDERRLGSLGSGSDPTPLIPVSSPTDKSEIGSPPPIKGPVLEESDLALLNPLMMSRVQSPGVVAELESPTIRPFPTLPPASSQTEDMETSDTELEGFDKRSWIQKLLQGSAITISDIPHIDKFTARAENASKTLRFSLPQEIIAKNSTEIADLLSPTSSQKEAAKTVVNIERLKTDLSHSATEAFGKVIAELEDLVDQAMEMAKHVAGSSDGKGRKSNGGQDLKRDARSVVDDGDDWLSTESGDSFLLNENSDVEEELDVLPEKIPLFESHTNTGSTSADPHIVIQEPLPGSLPSSSRKSTLTRKPTPYPPGTAANSHDGLATVEGSGAQSAIGSSSNPSDSAIIMQGIDKRPMDTLLQPPSAKTVSSTGSSSPQVQPFLSLVTVNDPTKPQSLAEASDSSSFSSKSYDASDAASSIVRRRVQEQTSASAYVAATRYIDSPISPVLEPREVRDYIKRHHEPPVNPRLSSAQLRCTFGHPISEASMIRARELAFISHQSSTVDGAGDSSDRISKDSDEIVDDPERTAGKNDAVSSTAAPANPPLTRPSLTLRNRRHYSFKGHGYHFNLHRSHRRQPVARDWGMFRKRYVAIITCMTTTIMGMTIGIYAGQVPSVQYAISDFNHYAIVGNVLLYIGLAISTFLCWPLPLLHGRKQYTLTGLILLLALQIPQAITVTSTRSPEVATFRVALLLPRALSGLAMGLVQINLKATLLDLFGASLQSSNPHQEVVVENDVRRHGGGMGVWLGIWAWCYVASVGLGFVIGAAIIESLNPAWGFWITAILISFALFMSIITPEVRRSPHRRSVRQIKEGDNISARVGKGEIMMHVHATGPISWVEELLAGYVGFIYGQVIMIVVLLGALASRYYRLNSALVGACVSAIPTGALLAIPFQKASLFSRARHHVPIAKTLIQRKTVVWSSHFVRRVFFTVALPFADMAYVLSSTGNRSTSIMVPTIFAGLIGFLSNMAIGECHGLIMETFDTSDLDPGTHSRQPQVESIDHAKDANTNYSSFPRVSAGLALTQSIGFIIAAITTAVGGTIERQIGTQTATGVVTALLLVLTILLFIVLWRDYHHPVVSYRHGRMAQRAKEVVGARSDVKGTPSERVRKMNILELGELSRWQEIRHLNGAKTG